MNLQRLLLLLAAGLFLTAGTVVPQTVWIHKAGMSGLGQPFCTNPKNDSIVYGAAGTSLVYISRDRGNSWQVFSSVSGASQIKAIQVSARDTNVMLVAQESGPPDRIMKSTDHGASWFQTLSGNFYYWGHPFAYEPLLDDDTVYTMASNHIYRSTDFGTTWDTIGVANPFGTANEGWEHAFIRPDSANVLLASDALSGIWKSRDYGVTWFRVHQATIETPTITYTPGHPEIMYGVRWGNGGGVVKSTNGGDTWNFIPQFNTVDMWGISISPYNPAYMIMATYGPALATTGGVYISRDWGATWERSYQGLYNPLNYACLVIDTLNVLVLQGDGIWKLQYPPGTVTLTSPNGGELWAANSVRKITWTEQRLGSVQLDFTTDDGATWQQVAANVQASIGSYDWTVPDLPSAQCRIRVRDASDSTITDLSDSQFTIFRPTIMVLRPNGGEMFHPGQMQDITWTSANVPRVRLQYTTDGGAGWNDIAQAIAAGSGVYHWLVPFASSHSCYLRLSDQADPLVVDLSDSAFSITDTSQSINAVIVLRAGNQPDTLWFGEMGGATDGLDPEFNETELPPKPGVDTFDIRWQIPVTLGSQTDIRGVLDMFRTECTHTMEIQPGSGGAYPLTLGWNPHSLPIGDVYLRDGTFNGDSVNIDMHAESLCVISNPGLQSLKIVHLYSTALGVMLKNGWNIISVPLDVKDWSKSVLFPQAASPAFAYDNSYVTQDVLSPGRGYWLRSNGDQSPMIAGRPCTADSIVVVQGWNLIGGITVPVAVSGISSDPPAIVTSRFFGYNGSYFHSETISPGCGYWVKTSQEGKLILSVGGGAAPAAARIVIVPSGELPPDPPSSGGLPENLRGAPAEFRLDANYPNPFNPVTHLQYSIASVQVVSLKVYDLLGREAATLVNETKQPGEYAVEWDAANQPSGVYYCRLQAGSFMETRRIVLLK